MYIILIFEPYKYISSSKMNKQNYYGIIWPHSMYGNNTTVRNIIVNVKKHLTPGYQEEKLFTSNHFPLALPSLTCYLESQVFKAHLLKQPPWALQCEVPVSASGKWPVDHSVPPLPREYKCHEDKMGKNASPWANKLSLFFHNLCWNRNLVKVVLVKTDTLRFSLASEPMRVNVHPQS